MTEHLVKEIIRLKYKAANTLIDNLPEKLGTQVKEYARILLSAVNEAAEEHQSVDKGKKDSLKSLRSISIDFSSSVKRGN